MIRNYIIIAVRNIGRLVPAPHNRAAPCAKSIVITELGDVLGECISNRDQKAHVPGGCRYRNDANFVVAGYVVSRPSEMKNAHVSEVQEPGLTR
jgi:hypothetical protein